MIKFMQCQGLFYLAVKNFTCISQYQPCQSLTLCVLHLVPTAEDFSVTCTAEDYMSSLTEFGGFVFFIMSIVSETKQTFSVQRDFVLKKPDLNIEVEIFV